VMRHRPIHHRGEHFDIHGHCNVPRSYSENSQLVWWVVNQRQQYRLYQEEKKSQMTIPRIKALKGLGFEWNRRRKSV
jgi:hypothetical protein